MGLAPISPIAGALFELQRLLVVASAEAADIPSAVPCSGNAAFIAALDNIEKILSCMIDIYKQYFVLIST